MKKLELFVLALATTLGLMVLAGAGVSQATVLCTTESSGCIMTYPSATAIGLSLKSGTTMALKNTSGSLEATCTGGAVSGKSGAETATAIPVELSEWSWSSCSQTTDTVASGSLEVDLIKGTHNGTVTGKGTEWKFTLSGVNCTFGTGTGTDLGTLTSGAGAVLDVNAVINKTAGSFLCPSTVLLEAQFVVTEPHALYVDQERVTSGGVLCTTEGTPTCTTSYPPGATVDLSLKSGTSMALKNTEGSIGDTCTGGTFSGSVGASAGNAVSIELTQSSWSSCSNTASTVAVGSLEIQRVEGTHNGTVIGKGTEWKFTISGVECTYGLGTGTDLGTLTGGTAPVLKISSIVNKKGGGFLCPEESVLEAEFVVTSPHALYLDEETVTKGGILCTAAETPECAKSYPEGRAIDLSRKSETSMVITNTSGSIEATCTGGTINGKRGTETSSTVSIELSEWSWSSCSPAATAVAAGSLEIHHIVGTHNGTVTGKGTEWKFVLSGVNCTFGTGTGTDLGTLTGGSEPVLDINAVINKTSGSFLCPSTVVLEANLVVTEPHALYVI
jgi:hypothetical protein